MNTTDEHRAEHNHHESRTLHRYAIVDPPKMRTSIYDDRSSKPAPPRSAASSGTNKAGANARNTKKPERTDVSGTDFPAGRTAGRVVETGSVRTAAAEELLSGQMGRAEKRESRNRHIARLSALLRIRLFKGVLFVFFIIGMIWFARPDTSLLEKRTLTKFPALTGEGFLNGDFFSGISTWYADTYPLREPMIAGFMKFQNLYGIRSEQLISEANTTSGESIPESADKTETAVSSGEPGKDVSSASAAEVAAASDAQDTENMAVADMDLQGDIYISGNNGYGLYYFQKDPADQMIRTFNQIYENIRDKADMYLMIVPNGSAIELNQATLDSLGASNDGDAIHYMYSGLEDGIKAVDAYAALKDHKDEYIYYHTDHHWTQLGAYYAYREFCSKKGIEPHALTDFTEKDYPGFLGSYYSESNQSPELASNPDTVQTWTPNGTNDMTWVSADGAKTDWWIVADISDTDAGNKYSAFAGGDNPFSYAHNDAIHDGSSVLIVKDSYGNALIPWLIDHYENIYWIDPRYDTTDTISKLETTYGIDDVIFECSIYNGTTTVLQDAYTSLGQ